MKEPHETEQHLDRISASFKSEQDRARRRTLWLTLVPIVVGALVVGSAWLGVSRAKNELADVEGNLDEARRAKQTLVAENAALEEKIAEGRAELEYVAALLEQGQTELAQRAAQRVEQTAPGQVRPRVYIHLSNEEQLPMARRIAAGLRERDFLVPKEEILVDAGPSVSQVRYFRRADAEEAESIAALLEQEGVANVQAAYMSGYEESTAIKSRHYEIWLAR
jgi:cell division protein FtsB